MLTFLPTGDAATHPGTGSLRTVRRPAVPLQELYLQPLQNVAREPNMYHHGDQTLGLRVIWRFSA